jgi:predicted nucleic acid-binding protein
MSCSSFRIDTSDDLVLDASVIINLHASKHGAKVIAVIPHDVWVPQIVVEELEHETSRKNGEFDFLQTLLASGFIRVAHLDEAEYEIFQNLTSTSPSLDDGEAATIAVAVVRRFLPVIDERRGRARATALIGNRSPAWSIDLLRHPTVTTTLGCALAVDVLYHALRFGRMRIPSESADAVISMLGVERAQNCTCLPGYRDRFARSL